MKIGLVFSGGGAKGAYEAGVIRALRDLDVDNKVTVVSGTSVGALNAVAFAMKRDDVCEKIWERIGFGDILVPNKKKDLPEIFRIVAELTTGNFKPQGIGDILRRVNEKGTPPFSQDGLRKLVDESLDESVLTDKNAPQLYVCARNIDKCTTKYFHLNKLERNDIIDATLASACIPYVFPPVVISGERYADGGVDDPAYPGQPADCTPIAPLREFKLDMVIVVHLDVKTLNTELDYSGLGSAEIVDIYPSEPLEFIRNTGMLDFSHKAIIKRIDLGYIDTIKMLPKILFKYK